MTNLRSLPLRVLASTLFAAVSISASVTAQQAAQQVRPEVRIAGPIDESQLVTLKGNVHPAAIAKNDRGPVSASLPMQDLVLVLSRSAEQQAAIDAYVQSEYDSSSPNFHHWLTADEIGEQYGPSQADVATITSWLASHGFAVSHTAKDRMTINFSGTAGQVESTFHTSIHNLSVNGVAHIANMTDPQIPAALAPVVMGIKQLHDFHAHPLHRVGGVVHFNQQLGKWQRTQSTAAQPASLGIAGSTTAFKPRPLFYTPGTDTGNGLIEEDVGPNDFAAIYNVQPLWTAGTTGTGQTIAIVGTSDVAASDITAYRSAFGLPAGLALKQVMGANGIDPGVCTSTSPTASCNQSDLVENTLDTEVSGGVATGAQVVLVTDGYNSTGTNDPIEQGAQYIEENIATSGNAVFGAHIMSLSYGLCELDQGTAGNIVYYNLWQSAAAAGLAVFVATGDSGSPSCDQGGDSDGNPYSAQLGLSVSGLASTPFNTAVGGTDFSWCQPTLNSKGDLVGCPANTSNPYWNTSNTSGNASAKGYVPETPWNDTCENPIWATFIESVVPLFKIGTTPTNADGACNYVENNWAAINQSNQENGGGQYVLAGLVDTVGASGGVSNCVVNTTEGENTGSCSPGSTTVDIGSKSVGLTNDGWQKPSWQTGVTGIPADGVRDLPDVSFFAGDGSLDSATLVCLDALAGASCTASTVENAALEIGGTSVATPEMAGVMALINQRWGAQGLPNKSLYELGAKQTYSECSAESVTSSSTCYFQSVDQGTIAMPCSLGADGGEGGAIYDSSSGDWELTNGYTGSISPNCTGLNAGDVIGTLVSSGTTPGYNAATGFNLATGLGSLNVANVVNASSVWVQTGSTASTVTVTPTPKSINPDQTVSVAITVAGSGNPTPTGMVTLSSGTYSSAATTLSGGTATIVIPADSLTGTGNTFSVTLTASYSGDMTYAPETGTADVTVTKLAPTVKVTAASTTNSNVAFSVSVAVTGSGGTPTGTATLTAGSYTSPASTLTSGAFTFTIPANTFISGGVVALNVAYSGDTTYTSGSGSGSVTVNYIPVVAPVVTVTPASSSVDSNAALNVTVAVAGTNGTATGTISLSGGGYSSAVETIGTSPCTSAASCVFTIPAGSFTSFGAVTLTASYSGDIDYFAKTGTASVTVTQTTYSLSAPTPTAISSPGGTTTATVTVSSTTGYNGTVAVTCQLQSAVGVAYPPTCAASGSGTATLSSGTTSVPLTFTVSTTAATAELVYPRMGKGKGWMGAGGGAVLAFLVFLGVPARRRSWRALLGVLVMMAALGALSACGGGGGGGGGSGTTGTSAGTYTFTITGTGNPVVSPAPSSTFTVTVN